MRFFVVKLSEILREELQYHTGNTSITTPREDYPALWLAGVQRQSG